MFSKTAAVNTNRNVTAYDKINKHLISDSTSTQSSSGFGSARGKEDGDDLFDVMEGRGVSEQSLLLSATGSSCVTAPYYSSADVNGNDEKKTKQTDNAVEDEAEENLATQLQQQQLLLQQQTQQQQQQTTMTSLMSKQITRAYLVSYWLNSFVVVCVNEAFPLFAMSTQGGLGIEERMIGVIETAAGCLFCIFQYCLYNCFMKRLGLLKTLQLGSLLCTLSIILFPVSLLLPERDNGSISWERFTLSSFLNANIMIMHSLYCAATTIGTNGTVEVSQRATLNGICSIGTSIARGIAPICVGFLVSISMTGVIVPAQYGSWLLYSVIAVAGFIATGSTVYLTE